MPVPSPNDLLDLWRRAKAEPHGLSIKTNDRSGLKRRLQAIRKDYGDDGLDTLEIALPLKPDDEVWIVKGEPNGLDTPRWQPPAHDSWTPPLPEGSEKDGK